MGQGQYISPSTGVQQSTHLYTAFSIWTSMSSSWLGLQVVAVLGSETGIKLRSPGVFGWWGKGQFFLMCPTPPQLWQMTPFQFVFVVLLLYGRHCWWGLGILSDGLGLNSYPHCSVSMFTYCCWSGSLFCKIA